VSKELLLRRASNCHPADVPLLTLQEQYRFCYEVGIEFADHWENPDIPDVETSIEIVLVGISKIITSLIFRAFVCIRLRFVFRLAKLAATSCLLVRHRVIGRVDLCLGVPTFSLQKIVVAECLRLACIWPSTLFKMGFGRISPLPPAFLRSAILTTIVNAPRGRADHIVSVYLLLCGLIYCDNLVTSLFDLNPLMRGNPSTTRMLCLWSCSIFDHMVNLYAAFLSRFFSAAPLSVKSTR